MNREYACRLVNRQPPIRMLSSFTRRPFTFDKTPLVAYLRIVVGCGLPGRLLDFVKLTRSSVERSYFRRAIRPRVSAARTNLNSKFGQGHAILRKHARSG